MPVQCRGLSPEIGGLYGFCRCNLRGRSFGEHAAAVEHGDPVGQMEHDAHVVLDQDNGEFAVAGAGGGSARLFRRFPGRSCPAVGSSSSSSRGRNASAIAISAARWLAMGEFADQPVRFVGKPDQCQRFSNDLAPPAFVGARGPQAQTLPRATSDGDQQFRAPSIGKDLGNLESARHAAARPGDGRKIA